MRGLSDLEGGNPDNMAGLGGGVVYQREEKPDGLQPHHGVRVILFRLAFFSPPSTISLLCNAPNHAVSSIRIPAKNRVLRISRWALENGPQVLSD
jgi:hypothetical protein